MPRCREYENLEQISRLWHERPDRWRQETDLSDGSGTNYRVADGKGPWWFYRQPEWADYSPTNDGGFTVDRDLSCLLDPSEARYDLDGCTLRILGRVERLGRETIDVEAKSISWSYSPSYPFAEGADDYRMLVDGEKGVILRLASRLREQEFNIMEVTEITFDEEFTEDVFRLGLPGVEFRLVEWWSSEKLLTGS